MQRVHKLITVLSACLLTACAASGVGTPSLSPEPAAVPAETGSLSAAASTPIPPDGGGASNPDTPSAETDTLQATLPTSSPAPQLTPLPVSGTARFELVAQWWGETRALAVDGERAFLGMGPRLLGFDVADPDHPHLSSEGIILPGIVQGVVVRQDIAYVIAGRTVQTLDVSGFPRITHLGGLDLPFVPMHLILDEQHLYLGGIQPEPFGSADFTSQLIYPQRERGALGVVDVSDPASPRLLSSLNTPLAIYSQALAGNALYAGSYLVDVSDPAGPGTSLNYGGFWGPNRVALAGDRLYVSDAATSPAFWDVSDPLHPAPVEAAVDWDLDRWQIPPGGHIKEDMLIAGDTIYQFVYYADDGFYIPDVVAGHLDPGAGPAPVYQASSRLARVGHRLYLANSGLEVYDVSGASGSLSTRLLGRWAMPYDVRDVAVRGNVLYLVSGGGRFREDNNKGLVVSLTLPDLEALAVYIDPPLGDPGEILWSTLTRIALEDERAYVDAWGGGLRIFDIHDPQNLQRIAALQNAQGYEGFGAGFNGLAYAAPAVLNGILYVERDGDQQIGMVDASDPAHPRVTLQAVSYHPQEVVPASNGLVYAVEWADGGDILHLHRGLAQDLAELGAVKLPSRVLGLAPRGDLALVATYQGLSVVSATTSGLELLANISLPQEGVHQVLWLDDTTALATSQGDAGGGTLIALDLSDPPQPAFLAMYPLPIGGAQIASDGEWVVVGSQDTGVMVLRLIR